MPAILGTPNDMVIARPNTMSARFVSLVVPYSFIHDSSPFIKTKKPEKIILSRLFAHCGRIQANMAEYPDYPKIVTEREIIIPLYVIRYVLKG